MSGAVAAARTVRAFPGRLRVHLEFWDGSDPARLERALGDIGGVADVQARPATGNVLILFETGAVDEQQLIEALAALVPAPTTSAAPAASRKRPAPPGESASASGPSPAHPRSDEPASANRPLRTAAHKVSGVLRDQAGRVRRARVAVRGIDRDPALARRVVKALERRPDVNRAVASITTGRVLIEFSDRVTSIQDALSDISSLELPTLPGEDMPAHPLDPAPVIQSGARLAGSLLGLGLLGAERLLRASPPPRAAQGAAAVAGVLGVVEGAPPARERLRETLGRDRAQLLLGGATIASLSLAGSPLGLLVSGAGALRLFTEARLRRDAWREYERRVSEVDDAQLGAVVRLETGSRVPLDARVVEGAGTVVGGDGLPDCARPGDELQAGARVLRGPLLAELTGGRAWSAQGRPRPPNPGWLERYLRAISIGSIGYALVYALKQRSPAAAFTGLLLVNPRAALIGSETADTGASARVLRAGVTVVGTRPERAIRAPNVLVIDGPRVLTSGLEQGPLLPVGEGDRGELADVVAAMMAASGSPWGPRLPLAHKRHATEAQFDGAGVTATVDRIRLRLEPADISDSDEQDEVRMAIDAGDFPLVLRGQDSGAPIAYVHLRPRLASGVESLRRHCREHGVELLVLERDDRRASRRIARRAEIPLVVEADLVELVRARQRAGERVAVLSDSPTAAEAFEAADLAIGLSSGRSSVFQARADLLAPGLAAVGSIINAGARREQASNASVALSVAANVAGAAWGLQGDPGLIRASQATYLGALGAMGVAWERLRGGRRARSIISRLTDPHPERWGAMSPQEVLTALGTSTTGLSAADAEERTRPRRQQAQGGEVLKAMGEQLESPLVAVLGAGAVLSMAVGAVADVGIIGAVIVANALVGAWQTRQAGKAVAALERLGAARATVVRDGEPSEIDSSAVVPGDILLLGAGDRLVADARLLEADALEVDEAALTGESLPVPKAADAERAEDRVLLDGSDVTVGSARVVVVAVGDETRMGATAAALAVEESGETPLSARLDQLFRQGMPLVLAGGLLVSVAGIAWGGPPLQQLAIGASVAVAAVPEGLPLLAGVAEAAVARRLASRSALVRRLSSVEALGRVDVACCDKTGTLTQGNLALTVVDDLSKRVRFVPELRASHAEVVLTAALASPAPDSPDAASHPTDVAVLAAAEHARMRDRLVQERGAEAPFDPVRSLHASVVGDRVCVKGATEALIARCMTRGPGGRSLGDRGRRALLARAESLAQDGLRVLMVADGPADVDVENPQGLRALGFVGISDPLRPAVAEAIKRCQDAGIRVVMLTGDHPATARAIARDAGLSLHDGAVITGEEIARGDNGELAVRLEHATVIARITPLDKLRIVDQLQEAGHTVAMTGDGVNDAPALRLASVGVAMGAGGTEVARQAADLVLADDRFETLTEALLEGRSLWHNLHGALGLLLGGNLGEVGLMAGAAIAGGRMVLGARQVLAVNLVTDVLPAVAVAVQPPLEEDLSAIRREASDSFDQRLVRDVLRRGAATALPSLAGVLLAGAVGAAPQTVAFASVIITQLAQTVQVGRTEDTLTRPVVGAVAASGGVLGMALSVPALRGFLGLPAPNLSSLLLSGATAPAAMLLARAI